MPVWTCKRSCIRRERSPIQMTSFAIPILPLAKNVQSWPRGHRTPAPLNPHRIFVSPRRAAGRWRSTTLWTHFAILTGRGGITTSRDHTIGGFSQSVSQVFLAESPHERTGVIAHGPPGSKRGREWIGHQRDAATPATNGLSTTAARSSCSRSIGRRSISGTRTMIHPALPHRRRG